MNANENRSTADVSLMRLMTMLWPAAMTVQAIHAAAQFKIADALADAPKTAQQVADATGADASSLARLLRALQSVGIFGEDPDGRFRQTPLSDLLRSNHPQSMRPWAMMLGAGFVWAPVGELAGTVATGRPGFERVH